jgi:hypothetical protein
MAESVRRSESASISSTRCVAAVAAASGSATIAASFSSASAITSTLGPPGFLSVSRTAS